MRFLIGLYVLQVLKDQNWDLVEVSADAARHLAVNGLPVNPETLIMVNNGKQRWPKLKACIEAHGIKTYHVVRALDIPIYGGRGYTLLAFVIERATRR